jgi:hypothetical protein
MKNCAVTIRLKPMVQSKRDPRRSESQPAMGGAGF